MMKSALLAVIIFLVTTETSAKTEWHSYSFQWQAMTANAGGQNAYAVRRGGEQAEMGLFMNEYLLTNEKPIFGGTYAFRYPICGQSCFWQAYVQLGGGLSTGGPLFEVTWSNTILWAARLDFTTQIFVAKNRLVTWSYPAWLGLSLPLPF